MRLLAQVCAAYFAGWLLVCDTSVIHWIAGASCSFFVGAAMQQKHLLGTTYRAGVPPSAALDFFSRFTFLCLMLTGLRQGLEGSSTLCVLLSPVAALYAFFYLDRGEASGGRHNLAARHDTSWYVRLLSWLLSHRGEPPGAVAAAGWQPPLPPQEQFVFGLHPHGVFPLGLLLNLGTSYTGRDSIIPTEMPLLFCAASFCFYVPAMREIFLRWGVVDASRHLIRAHLSRGYSIAVFPGGAAEAQYAAPGKAELVLKKRRGFVELALERGASLVPVYTFGDTACLSAVPWNLFGFAEMAKGLTGIWMPPAFWPCRRQCACTTLVGKPIPVPKKGPGGYTPADVDRVLARYISALEALYADNVGKYGGSGAASAVSLLE
jgi:2-acylglycerol O-acyltransferase 2